MRPWAAGLSTSLIIHGTLVLTFYGLAISLAGQPRQVTIDLSVLSAPGGAETVDRQTRRPAPAMVPAQSLPQSPPLSRPAAVVAPKLPKMPPLDSAMLTTPVLGNISAPPMINKSSMAKEPFTQSINPEPADNTETLTRDETQIATGTPAEAEKDSGPVNDPVGAEAQWRRENFSYVQEVIRRNLNYPLIARRNGWQGRVLVCFEICRDGRVENIRIEQSSGFALLDKNAAATIRQIAPFPSPPVRATLVVPIDYNLS